MSRIEGIIRCVSILILAIIIGYGVSTLDNTEYTLVNVLSSNNGTTTIEYNGGEYEFYGNTPSDEVVAVVKNGKPIDIMEK